MKKNIHYFTRRINFTDKFAFALTATCRQLLSHKPRGEIYLYWYKLH